jgi:hypothetical protein
LNGLLTAAGILLGLAVVAFAVTLPGSTVRGLVLGGSVSRTPGCSPSPRWSWWAGGTPT